MTTRLLKLVVLTLALVPAAFSAVIMDYVLVGDPGNPNDPTTGYGGVNYSYAIEKYEVTNAQYAEFLNTKARSDPFSLYTQHG